MRLSARRPLSPLVKNVDLGRGEGWAGVGDGSEPLVPKRSLATRIAHCSTSADTVD